MDTISMADARKRLEDLNSCFVLLRLKEHIILPPRYIGQVTYGVHQILKAKRGYYSDNLKGVLIAYDEVQFMQPLGIIQDDMPYIHFDIEANFIVFRPVVSQKLTGVINKVSNDHIGCLVHECFNASIPRWSEYGDTDVCQRSGCEIGDEIAFKVTRIYVQNFVLSMSGSFCELRQKAIGDLFDFRSPEVSIHKQAQSSEPSIVSDSVHIVEGSSESKPLSSTNGEQTGERVSEKKAKKKLKMITVNDLLSPDTCNMESGKEDVHLHKKKKRKKHSVSETFESPSSNVTLLLGSDALQDIEIEIKQEPSVYVNDAGILESSSSKHLSSTTDVQTGEYVHVSGKKVKKKLKMVSVNDLLSPDNMDSGHNINEGVHHHKKKKKWKRHSVSETFDAFANSQTFLPGSDAMQDMKIEIKQEPSVYVNDAGILESCSSKHLSSTTDVQTGEYVHVSGKKAKKKLKMVSVNDLLSPDNMDSGHDINEGVHHHKKKKKRKRHSVSETLDAFANSQTFLPGSDAIQDMKIEIKQEPSVYVNDAAVLENDCIIKKKKRIKKDLDIKSSVSEDFSSSSYVLHTTNSQSDPVIKKKKRKHSDAILSDLETKNVQIQNVSPPQIKKLKSSDSSDTNSIVRKRTQSASFNQMCSEIINEMSVFTQIKIKKEKHTVSSDATVLEKRKKKHSHHRDKSSVAATSPYKVSVKIKKEKLH